VTTCSTSDAPAPWNVSTCTLGSATVCGIASNRLVCEGPTTCDAGIQMYAANVSSADSISVFGACDIRGTYTRFCCHVDDSGGNLDNVTLVGTSSADEPLAFHYLDTLPNPDVAYDLAATGSSMTAVATGLGGPDILIGSDTTASSYEEELYGNGGDDDLLGGAGNDKLFGLSGNDTLNGGAGNDWIRGGDGNDIVHGGANNDVITGDDGNDELNGGGGNDTLCAPNVPPGEPCPTWDLGGGAGSNDKAYLEDFSFHTCGQNVWPSFSAPTGNDSVEIVRPATMDWTDVVVSPGGTIQTSNTPYAECTTLWSL
jgi:Ca2+-binding RTX toxin-like protein